MPERLQCFARPTHLRATRLSGYTEAKVGYFEEQRGVVCNLHPAEDPMDVPSQLLLVSVIFLS